MACETNGKNELLSQSYKGRAVELIRITRYGNQQIRLTYDRGKDYGEVWIIVGLDGYAKVTYDEFSSSVTFKMQ